MTHSADLSHNCTLGEHVISLRTHASHERVNWSIVMYVGLQEEQVPHAELAYLASLTLHAGVL